MKKDEQKAKNDTDANTPGGIGNELERASSKLFLLPAATILEKWYDASWFLYRMKPRCYNVQKIKDFSQKGRPMGGFRRPKSHFWAADPPFFCYTW